MDKEAFGSFIAELRKEKNMTQKELADRLLISDKAVSKWERGLSFPDITLIESISLVLDVSLTELFQGRRNEMKDNMDNRSMEEILKETIRLENEKQEELEKRLRRSRLWIIIGIICVAALEIRTLFTLGVDMAEASMHIWTAMGLAAFFGLYFWVFIKERIPTMYDENKLSVYTDGFMEIHMPGVNFNNSNWPHVIKGIRIWSAVLLLLYPVITFAMDRLGISGLWCLPICLGAVFTVFPVIFVTARKYE